MSTTVSGDVAEGFGPVADAYAATLDEHGSAGGACAAYVDGELVVNLWAGRAGSGPWSASTRSVVFSVSKGITALCLLMAAEGGDLALDDRVVVHWPEFGIHGKDRLTVRELLAHRGGLPLPLAPLTREDVLAWHPVTAALAQQAPMWKPGQHFAYHPLTMGWLAGEVLRRATGLRPHQWLQDRIAKPLGLATTFGTEGTSDAPAPILPEPKEAGITAADSVAGDVLEQAMTMHGAFQGEDLFEIANTTDFLEAEVAAANLVSSARDLARLYAATVGHIDGVRLIDDATLADAIRPCSQGTPILGPDEGLRWGAGFMLESPRRPMLGPGSFGHDGAGGQLAIANAASRASLAFQTTQPGTHDDDRANAISAALLACL